jgi:hypothetical protein
MEGGKEMKDCKTCFAGLPCKKHDKALRKLLVDSKEMKYYKVLSDGKSCNGGHCKWRLPTKNKDGTWIPGKWMPKITGELVPCNNGYHICRKEDLIYWLDKEIYEVEYRGEIIEDDDKCVVREARLLCKVEAWNEKTARLFAADCAEKVLPIFEKQYPEDNRPRLAIKATRDYANGKITQDELSAAESAARSAAESAAWSAVRRWQTKRLFKYLTAKYDLQEDE